MKALAASVSANGSWLGCVRSPLNEETLEWGSEGGGVGAIHRFTMCPNCPHLLQCVLLLLKVLLLLLLLVLRLLLLLMVLLLLLLL